SRPNLIRECEGFDGDATTFAIACRKVPGEPGNRLEREDAPLCTNQSDETIEMQTGMSADVEDRMSRLDKPRITVVQKFLVIRDRDSLMKLMKRFGDGGGISHSVPTRDLQSRHPE